MGMLGFCFKKVNSPVGLTLNSNLLKITFL